jgi:hypothetical protein
MSKIQITGPSTGTGTLTITSTATNTDQTITFPNTTATVVAVDPGTASNVLTSNGSAWVSQAAAAGGGDYIMQAFTTPGTWAKPAGLKAVKVTVIGGGGAAGNPTVVPGGTSSFGPTVSATGGTGGFGPTPAGAGGSGSGGTINVAGGTGLVWSAQVSFCPPQFYSFGMGGEGGFGFSSRPGGIWSTATSGSAGPVLAGKVYGGGAARSTGSTAQAGGGGGGAIAYIDAPALPGPVTVTVGTGGTIPAPAGNSGAAGIVIVEEFY